MVNNMIEHANNENFDSLINNELVLVDFYATWCGPCKMLSPVLENLVGDRDNLKIVKVDIDKSEELAKKYGVMAVPTLILFKNGSEISKQTGFMPGDMLKKWIDDNK